jgi:hypothetical protein
MKLTKEQMILESDADELWCLFKTLLGRLEKLQMIHTYDKDKKEWVSAKEIVVLDSDLMSVVKEMKIDYS